MLSNFYINFGSKFCTKVLFPLKTASKQSLMEVDDPNNTFDATMHWETTTTTLEKNTLQENLPRPCKKIPNSAMKLSRRKVQNTSK